MFGRHLLHKRRSGNTYPEGRALPHIVWDLYRNGCSVRFLNPQAFIPDIHRINSELQEKLGFVGCNLYLTPAGSQGFAPHYDDIEAFVLQIEGSKHWKVYAPLSEAETLPRYSSKNLSESDLGPPIIDCVLNPGDLLFFPRGFVHQAKTTDEHSLHITLSAYQCTAYIDMFEKVIPNVLKEAASKSVKLREGLPLNYAQTFGITRNSKYSDARSIYKQKLKEMLHDLVENMDYDAAVDEFAAVKLHDDLPLYLTDGVKKCTVFGNRNTIDPDGKVSKVVQLQLDSKVSLLQLNICRLVKEDERYLLYHSMSNSLEYHERDREFLEVPEDNIEAVRRLFHSYPNYVKVADLPIDDDEAK
ncbi:bifunctional lysine-specific demethylase and histidyl-hydroxylase NO66-like, partial [Nilaparvata lugens]|uniref:bifunctional lysine-specific demethylase and histidyl-hydroxylase NO66-like n=1 Tax=Nilaparvata lugens TaxID=108931 RepID=UPI00193D3C60